MRPEDKSCCRTCRSASPLNVSIKGRLMATWELSRDLRKPALLEAAFSLIW